MNRNQRRNARLSSPKRKIELLEKAVSAKDKFFSTIKLARLKRRLSSWVGKLLISIVVLLIGFYIYDRIRESAAKLKLDEIEFESRGYITKEQILHILNLKSGMPYTELNTQQLIAKLQEKPFIEHANIILELPGKLHIQVEERLPLAFIENEQGLITGESQQYFICNKGLIMEILPEYHRSFLESPTWYVTPRDYDVFQAGGKIKDHSLAPILDTITAVNAYELDSIPAVKEIFRPKPWKTVLILSSGEEVTMSVFDIPGQISRLALILDHARSTQRHVRSVNVIPKLNPAVIYHPAGAMNH